MRDVCVPAPPGVFLPVRDTRDNRCYGTVTLRIHTPYMTPYDSRRLRELAALRLVWASAAWLTNPNFHKLGPGICTRDTRDNSGPGGKPAQYRSKTPPKGHTRFTHTVHAHTVHTHCSHTRTTKNKLSACPRCAARARYSTTVSHPCSHLYGTTALMRRPRSSSRSGLPQRPSSHRDGVQRLVGSSYHLRDG